MLKEIEVERGAMAQVVLPTGRNASKAANRETSTGPAFAGSRPRRGVSPPS
jgi:hypothetical protein